VESLLKLFRVKAPEVVPRDQRRPTGVDASLVVLPYVGFITFHDDRMLGTIARLNRI
jgi:GH15 family glucan-1,4-alpha-glucosidase